MWLISYLWKTWQIKEWKNHFLAKILIFGPKITKFSNIRNQTKVAKHSHAFRWLSQIFGNFSFIYFFTLIQKILDPKINFWQFLKNVVFSQTFDYLFRFFVKFPFQKMYTFIYFTLLVFKLRHKLHLHKTLQNCKGGTILKLDSKIQFSIVSQWFVNSTQECPKCVEECIWIFTHQIELLWNRLPLKNCWAGGLKLGYFSSFFRRQFFFLHIC